MANDFLLSLLDKENDLKGKIAKLKEEISSLEKEAKQKKQSVKRQQSRSVSNNAINPASSKDVYSIPKESVTNMQTTVTNTETITTTTATVSPEVVYEDYEQFEAPEWCIPIKTNVMTFEWDKLASAVQFDAILMDPPWQLASHQPTRGVAIGYQQLPDACIEELPIETLQTNGFILIWVINNKYTKAFELMEKWGYTYVDEITWVKQTVNRRMAKGHGYYLQHAKETCLMGRKGQDPPGCQHGILSDVIFSERRGQSQKPVELYEMIEELIPNGNYLEIFGRKNNLRDFWVTIGNEL